MYFICSKDAFLESIQIVSKAVPQKSSMTILECILLVVNEDGFYLLANDLDLGIESALIPCQVFNPGKICLEAKLLFEIIRRMPEDTITIQVDENNVAVIQSGKSEFKILGQDTEGFPALPEIEKLSKFEIFSTIFKDMIKQTIFSVCLEGNKPVFKGELMDIKNDHLNMVTVDGFRVSHKSTVIFASGQNIKAIVPAKTLNEISKILPQDAEDQIAIYFTDKHVLFEMKTCRVVSRLIEGEFINYEQVFTEDFNTIITAKRVELIGCLDRSLIISKENNKNPVKLSIKKGLLLLSSKNEMGTTHEELNVDTDGDALEIAFNPRYLMDALKVIDEDQVTLQFTTPLSPCIIKPVGDQQQKYLVLPLRLR